MSRTMALGIWKATDTAMAAVFDVRELLDQILKLIPNGPDIWIAGELVAEDLMILGEGQLTVGDGECE